MLSLVNESKMDKENAPTKNSQEAAELLGFSSSDSLDSPSFSHFQAPKQKRKVRFKKPFRSSSVRSSSAGSSKRHRYHSSSLSGSGQWCRVVEGVKILSCFSAMAVVGALLWYVFTLGQRIQELQDKFADRFSGQLRPLYL